MSIEAKLTVLFAIAVVVSTPWWLFPAIDWVCDAITDAWRRHMFGGRR